MERYELADGGRRAARHSLHAVCHPVVPMVVVSPQFGRVGFVAALHTALSP